MLSKTPGPLFPPFSVCSALLSVSRLMRLIIQRVTSAKVEVEGEVVSEIGRGLFILVGITSSDTPADAEYLKKKLLGIRLWESADGKSWAKNVVEQGYEVLLVSQFTLYGSVVKGTKPDFHAAMPSSQSKTFYEDFVKSVEAAYESSKVKDGRFGAMMQCSLTNDGPVTLQIDSRKYTYDAIPEPKSKSKTSGSSTPQVPSEPSTPVPSRVEDIS